MKKILYSIIWLITAVLVATVLLSISKGNIYFIGWNETERGVYCVVMAIIFVLFVAGFIPTKEKK